MVNHRFWGWSNWSLFIQDFFLVLGSYYYCCFPVECCWHAVFSVILPFSVSVFSLAMLSLLLPFNHTRLLSSSSRTNYILIFSSVCFLFHSSHMSLPIHTNWNLHKGKDHVYLVYHYIPSIYHNAKFNIDTQHILTEWMNLSFSSCCLLVLINFLKIWQFCSAPLSLNCPGFLIICLDLLVCSENWYF